MCCFTSCYLEYDHTKSSIYIPQHCLQYLASRVKIKLASYFYSIYFSFHCNVLITAKVL